MAKKVDLSGFEDTVKKYDLSGFDDVQKADNPELPSQLQSLGLGAAQGATMGFADEGEAALRSMLENASYEDLLKNARERYRVAEEANPWSYGGGQFGGGLVTAAVPGLGPVGAGKGVAQLAGMVRAGALGGALTSVGTREDDKLSKQSLVDAGEGALIGGGGAALLGSALPALGGKIAKTVKGSEVGQDVAEVFNKIRSGAVKTFSREALPQMAQDVRDVAKTDIIGNVDKIRKAAGETYKHLDDMAAKQETEIPVGDRVNTLRMKMPGAQQDVSESDLAPLQKNFGGLLGEEDVTKQVARELNPEEAEAKVMHQLRGKAASSEVRAERNFAREYLRSKMRNDLRKIGLEGQALNDQVEGKMGALTSDDIDEAVDLVRSLNLRERTQFPPAIEVNPETGLSVGVVKRADADTVQSIPDTKLEKVTEKVATRGAVQPKELTDYISNIKGLLTDRMKQDKPALYKYTLDVKNELETALRSGMPEEWTKAKGMADKLYKEVLTEGAAKDLSLPKNMGTSYQGQTNLGRAEEQIGTMVKNVSTPGHDDAINMKDFFNRLRQNNADEIGLSSTGQWGKAGPATIDQIEQNVMDKSRNLQLAERASSISGLQGGAKGVQGWWNMMQQSVRAKTLGSAELAGNTTKVYDKGMSWARNATPEVISKMATRITDAKLSQLLQRVAGAPDAKRKALMFSIMQQPAYREQINNAQEEPTDE